MTHRPLIAIVDDEPLIAQWLAEHLGRAGYRTVTARTGGEGVQAVRDANPDLVILDLRLPDMSGIDVLRRCRDIDPELVVIMATAYGEIETAVEAVKAGAYDFLQKPLDPDNLLLTIEQGLETRRLRRAVAGFRAAHRWQFAEVELVGRSQQMRDLATTVEKIARTESATVLLHGESGTGKDLVARAIHARSRRREGPFLAINCTALPEHLLESELFGHERGAFTDARERRQGLAELADGGTLLLDEIGDMPLAAQAKLLRFLEDSTFKRLGGSADVAVDVRIIAATNRDLEQAIGSGSFRNDLYYRLKVVPLSLAPLRERPEDVVPLALYFAERLARDLKRPTPTLSDEALRMLEAYGWPGNVRELRNVLERALILENVDLIRPEHLPAEIHGHRQPPVDGFQGGVVLPPDGISLDDVELELIRQAWERAGRNVSRAARLLRVSRDTLRYRLEKYGLTRLRGQARRRS